MKKIRLLFAVLAALVATSAFAQFGQEQKDEVIGEIGKVLTDEAFVPGVDLKKWDTFIASRKDKIASTESAGEFADEVNGALREFGLSHIQLIRSRGRRGGGDELSAQQGSRFGSGATAYRLDDDSALLRVPSFERGYDEEYMSALFDKISESKYLVIDLRGNPGGEVEKMRQFLGFLMPSTAPIGTFVSRSIANDYFRSKKTLSSDPIEIANWAHKEFTPRRTDVQFKGKVAVLLDGHSASASEIVANALHEQFNSPIVGAPSAGAVLVSTFDRLSYGFQIQFPVGDYVSHGGVRLEGHPIKPDLAASGDDVVEQALAKLKG